MKLQRVLGADGRLGDVVVATAPNARDPVTGPSSKESEGAKHDAILLAQPASLRGWRPGPETVQAVATQYVLREAGLPTHVGVALRDFFTARPRVFATKGGGGKKREKKPPAKSKKANGKQPAVPEAVAGVPVVDPDAEPFAVFEECERDGERVLCLPRAAPLAWWGIPRGARDARCDGDAFPTPGLAVTITPTTEPPQDKALAAIAKAWAVTSVGAEPNGGLVILPCGAGKTAVAIMAAERRGRCTLVVVSSDDLGEQWTDRIEAYVPGAHIGTIQGKRVNVEGADFVIATVQSLFRRDYGADVMNRFGTVILDEVHHNAARCFSLAFRKFPARCILGLTATPDRPDGLAYVLTWTIGPTLFRCRRAFADVDVEFVRHEAPEGTLRRRAGIKGKSAMVILTGILARDERRNTRIVDCIRQRVAQGRKVIVLTALRDHVEALLARVRAEMPGVTSDKWMGVKNGKSKKGRAALRLLRKAAAACQVIVATYASTSEGLDIPAIDTVLLASPKGAIEQSIGRGMRAHPNKQRPTIVEFDDVDCHQILTGVHHSHRRYYGIEGYNVKTTGDAFGEARRKRAREEDGRGDGEPVAKQIGRAHV